MVTPNLRADALRHYLRNGARRTFQWGQCDCLMWVAAWVQLRTGKPAWSTWSAAGHTSAVRAHRALVGAGGVLGLMQRETARFGLDATSDPRCGDVGVVMDAAGQHVGAIRIGARWAVKTATGVAVSPFPTVAAWSVPDA